MVYDLKTKSDYPKKVNDSNFNKAVLVSLFREEKIENLIPEIKMPKCNPALPGLRISQYGSPGYIFGWRDQNHPEEGYTSRHESTPGHTDSDKPHTTEKVQINNDNYTRHEYDDGSYRIWKNDKEV